MGGKINGEVVDKRKIMMNSKISTRKNIDFDDLDNDDDDDEKDKESDKESDDDNNNNDDDDDRNDSNNFNIIKNIHNDFSCTKKRKLLSILPLDKSFSPVLFLSLIHGEMSFDDLRG